MAASPTTSPSTPKLSEVARHLRVPSGIVSTGWPSVRQTCVERLGVKFDGWQDAAGRIMLAKRTDGHLAAMIDGVGLSLPRQVGKTYLVGATVFALCVNQPGLLVIWSAHHARTHGETFLAMQGFAERSQVKPYVQAVFTGSGTEEIRFHNGSRILFGARERGFGRGIPGVDVLIFDEAQILSDRALSNMLATMNTSKFGLQLYIGTPPKPDDMSEAFTRMRVEALAGRLTDGVWIELGADPNANPDDRAQWRKANPSYPGRTPVQSMLRLKRKLTEADWLREGLGIWDDDALTTIPMNAWAACGDEAGQIDGRVVLSVDMAFDRSRTYVGVCGPRSDGRRQVEVIELHADDVPAGVDRTGWLVQKIAAAARDFNAPVVVASNGGAAALIPLLKAETLDVEELAGNGLAQACGAFYDAVVGQTLAHLGDEGLTTAVRGAQRRTGETFVFTRRGSVDISPLYAALLAYWGWTTRHATGDVLRAVW